MKKNLNFKKFFILSLIFLFVLSIGSSFAGDNSAMNDNNLPDAAMDNANAVESSSLADVSEEPSSQNIGENYSLNVQEENSLSSSGCPSDPRYNDDDYDYSAIDVVGDRFEDLQDAINSACDNDTIKLFCDLYGDGKQIIVNKSVTIDGNGKTLDANYSSRIFCILSDNVTLKNVRLIHGYQRCYDPYVLRPYGESENYDSDSILSIEYSGYTLHQLNSTADNEYGTGPAIKWVGNNGKLIDSAILDNTIDYIDDVGEGKAVSWLGNDGRIINTYMGYNNYSLFTNLVCHQQSSDGNVLDTPVHGIYYGKFDGNVFFPDVSLNAMPNFSLKNISSYYGDGEKVSFNLNHDDVSFVNEKLEVSILSKKYHYTFEVSCDEKGNVEFNLPKNLTVGSYDLIVKLSAGSNNYTSNTSLTIKKVPVKVTAPNFKAAYASGAKYNLTLVDARNNKPIKDMEVNLHVFNGKKIRTYTIASNKKGIATFDFFTFPSVISSVGKHSVSFSIDSNYNLSKKKFTVQITKAKTNVKLSKTSFKYKKSDYLKISVKNKITKKAVKSLKIKVKIYTGKKFKTYTLNTDKNGMIKINVKGLSKGSHKVLISTDSKKYVVSKTTSIKIK